MSAAPKTLLESLLLDDSEERVKTTAGALFGVRCGLRDIGKSVKGALDGDREDLETAAFQIEALMDMVNGKLDPLVRYAERNGPPALPSAAAEERRVH